MTNESLHQALLLSRAEGLLTEFDVFFEETIREYIPPDMVEFYATNLQTKLGVLLEDLATEQTKLHATIPSPKQSDPARPSIHKDSDGVETSG